MTSHFKGALHHLPAPLPPSRVLTAPDDSGDPPCCRGWACSAAMAASASCCVQEHHIWCALHLLDAFGASCHHGSFTMSMIATPGVFVIGRDNEPCHCLSPNLSPRLGSPLAQIRSSIGWSTCQCCCTCSCFVIALLLHLNLVAFSCNAGLD